MEIVLGIMLCLVLMVTSVFIGAMSNAGYGFIQSVFVSAGLTFLTITLLGAIPFIGNYLYFGVCILGGVDFEELMERVTKVLEKEEENYD